MANVTVSVSDELKKEMDKLSLINWSSVARSAFEKTVADLKLLESITAKSKLTEEDALELGRKIKKGMHERMMKEHPGAY